MWRQLKLLSKIQLCNLFGFNQMRFGKDEKQKGRFILMAVTFAILGILIVAFSVILASSYVMLGMGEMIPAFVLTAVSILTLVFTMYKAGGVLFNMQTYEMLISLPVSPSAIVLSRFFSMYIQNVGMGCLVMIPSTIIYGISINAGIVFYLQMFAGALLMPLLPMTIATAAGALITGISSRMKHKNIVSVVLSLVLVIGFLIFFSMASVENYDVDGELTISSDMIHELGEMMQKQIYATYPPAKLFSEGIINNNGIAFLEFAVLSIGVFLLMVFFVQRKFVSICTALQSNRASKSYQKQALSTKSPIYSLYKKELKRYFASSIYVLNTSICYILMVVFSAGLFFAGQEQMEALLQFPGVLNTAPMLLAMMCGIINTTGCSISMEGKQWWLAQSLPISSKQLFDSKIMVNLTIALPCYLLTEIFMFLSLKLSVLDGLWMILLPLFYIIFSAVLGMAVNIKMPMFQWESETIAVKQGGSIFVCLLVGMGSALIPLLAAMIAGGARHIVFAVTLLLIGGTTAYLYRKNVNVDIRTIGE